MNRHTRSTARQVPRARIVLVAGLVAAGVFSAIALAQVQLASGRALDANLQLGSGGYNSRVATGNPMTSLRYAPGVYNTRAYDSIATRATIAANVGADGTWGTRNTFLNSRYSSISDSRPYRPGGFTAPPPMPAPQSGMWVGTFTFPVSDPTPQQPAGR